MGKAAQKIKGDSTEAFELSKALNVIDKWHDPDHIRLHAGEMTNQEMRSVLAVLRAVRAELVRGPS